MTRSDDAGMTGMVGMRGNIVWVPAGYRRQWQCRQAGTQGQGEERIPNLYTKFGNMATVRPDDLTTDD